MTASACTLGAGAGWARFEPVVLMSRSSGRGLASRTGLAFAPVQRPIGIEALLALVRLMRGQNVKGKSRSEVLPQTQAFAAQELEELKARVPTK